MSAREIGDVVDDLVGVWHDTETVSHAVSLSAFLGMTDPECDAWAAAPSSYPERLHGYARWLHAHVVQVCGHTTEGAFDQTIGPCIVRGEHIRHDDGRGCTWTITKSEKPDAQVERVARWLWGQELAGIVERTWTWEDIREEAREGYRGRAREVIALIEEDQ